MAAQRSELRLSSSSACASGEGAASYRFWFNTSGPDSTNSLPTVSDQNPIFELQRGQHTLAQDDARVNSSSIVYLTPLTLDAIGLSQLVDCRAGVVDQVP